MAVPTLMMFASNELISGAARIAIGGRVPNGFAWTSTSSECSTRSRNDCGQRQKFYQSFRPGTCARSGHAQVRALNGNHFLLARGGTWMQRWRVPLGFACAALFLYFAQSTATTLIIGAVVALPGLALRAWASGHLRKN